MINLKYLITGTGRCGTVFISRFLTSVGIVCTHEAFFTPFGLGVAKERLEKEYFSSSRISRKILPSERYGGSPFKGKPIAESSHFAAPFLDSPILKDTVKIHLIRHPYKVISSFVTNFSYFKPNSEDKLVYRNAQYKFEPLTRDYVGYFYKHFPQIIKYTTAIDRATAYYILCNKLIENKGFLHRIEDPIEDLMDYLNISHDLLDVSYKNIKANTLGKNVEFNCNDITNEELRKELIELMEKYGYNEIEENNFKVF